MLALRLTRGAGGAVQLRRLAVAVASGGVGFLLLATLGHAAAFPARAGDASLRLLWCALPLAAAVQLAVATARTDLAPEQRRRLAAAGYGPVRLALLGASSAAVSCALGGVAAGVLFLGLRGDLGTPALPGTEQWLGAGAGVPLAAVFTLLTVVPTVAAGATAVALRPRGETATGGDGTGAPGPAAREGRGPGAFLALPWGVALITAGLALGSYSAPSAAPAGPAAGVPLGERLGGVPAGVAGGWALVAAGLVIALPGVTQLSGWLLAAGRPGALRLLAGRFLQTEAARVGRPVGVACAVFAALLVAGRLSGGSWLSELPASGPLLPAGMGLVAGCTALTVVISAAESRAERADTTDALLHVGAPAVLLRRAVALRVAVVAAVAIPLSWSAATLATLPLTP
ncbi:hypothetical protein [Streptomyces zingiberis]|uniref:Integral membrane protein n=1 Tax=Streptomyces zingiberis TaxID=2053010 RepID=A0ABX1C2Z1_9ACTN|nr:hypothetical protein [Streptomyces zingiberis]NJQ02277.1 hypothetical protein [Streptomyces zingiberis]